MSVSGMGFCGYMTMNILKAVNLIFRYKVYSPDRKEESFHPALQGLDLTVNPGDFVGILGRNGSGKSTLAKELAGLLTPSEGYVYIDGLDSSDSRNAISIRGKVGMVFQNPDNQIVGNTVEEDVAFGPENLGVPQEELSGRVEKALSMVSMNAYCYDSPGRLSGGQKQKIAIAGILAMEPKCIILDEPTLGMDGFLMQELESLIKMLKEEGKTVIIISHEIPMVFRTVDDAIILNNGKKIFQGTREQLATRDDIFDSIHISMPPAVVMSKALGFDRICYNVEEFVEEAKSLKVKEAE